MEPPLKRPRLSIFADEAPNIELDSARNKNDRLLKNRFESIFAKYERDFSGIGDEIDLATGEILVNNGHLDGLDEDADTRSEADESVVGESSPRSIRTVVTPAKTRPIASGRAMLRAMTVASDRKDAFLEDNDAEKVIESIEAIAETAVGGEDVDEEVDSDANALDENDDADDSDDGDDSDQENQEPIPLSHPDAEHLVNSSCTQEVSAADNSDVDSLFGEREETASNPDSLFGSLEAGSSATPAEDLRPHVELFDALGDLDRDAIIARFGESIGEEVLNIIERRDQAELHIERAWRIPVQLEQNPDAATLDADLESSPKSRHQTMSPSTPRQGMSLWNLGLQGARRLELQQERTMRVIRAESEDPLQEGFAEGGEVEVRVVEVTMDRGKRLLNRGTCPFCNQQFYRLEAAIQHLRDTLAIPSEEGAKPELHLADRVNAMLEAVEDRDTASETMMGEQLTADGSDNRVVYDSVEGEDVVNPNASQDTPDIMADSDDDLFADIGYVHSDAEDEALLESPSTIKKELTSPLQNRLRSLEIPESDNAGGESMNSSPPQITTITTPQSEGADVTNRPKGSSARRKRKSSPHHSDSAVLPASDPASTPYPAFKETADPFDRDGDRNYRGRNWNRKSVPVPKSHLSLRPRTAQQRRAIRMSPSESEAKSAKLGRSRNKRCSEKDTQRNQSKKRDRKRGFSEKQKPAVRSQGFSLEVPSSRRSPTDTPSDVVHQALPEDADATHVCEDAESQDQDHTSLELPAQSRPRHGVRILNSLADNHRDDYQRGHDSNSELGADVELSEHFEIVHTPHGPDEADELDSLFEAEQDNEAEEKAISDDNEEQQSDAAYNFNVQDFKHIVILHEFQGYSLEVVGPQMAWKYYSYRRSLDPGTEREPGAPWTADDDKLLIELSMHPTTLMETIRRRLPYFSRTEIGQRLAERWLYEAHLPPEQQHDSHTQGATCNAEEPHGGDCAQPPPSNNILVAKAKKSKNYQLLNLHHPDAILDECLDPASLFDSRGKHPVGPISTRICRMQDEATSTWRGCGKVFSQRSALLRHWNTTNFECLRPGFDRTKTPPKQDRKRSTKDKGGIQCRDENPGGTVKGCGEWFSSKSTMYRHWRTSGAGCRPSWYTKSRSDVDLADDERGRSVSSAAITATSASASDAGAAGTIAGLPAWNNPEL